MKLLLDTHIWLWSLLAPEKLAPSVARELESPENELWLSPISVWELLEIAIRSRLVDLPHQDPADRFIAATAIIYGLTLVTADGQILSSKTLSLLPNQ
jgi:PIN domain nuclease of toxin-antitoxin system